MKSSVVFAVITFLCPFSFSTKTVGKNLKFWPKTIVEAWPNPSEISRDKMFLNIANTFKYEDSKVWICTYSNGSAPAISISPFIPSPSTQPSSPPPIPKASPPLSKPSPPKTSSPPPTSSPSTPKTSLSPPKPSPPKTSTPEPTPSPSTPKTFMPPPTPSHPSLAPKTSPPPFVPPKKLKKTPSPTHYQNRREHVEGCMRNMGHTTMCRVQIEMSFFTRMFRVSDRCCNLIVNMKNECDDGVWGFFTDPFFLPLVRCTCHVSY